MNLWTNLRTISAFCLSCADQGNVSKSNSHQSLISSIKGAMGEIKEDLLPEIEYDIHMSSEGY